MQYFLKTVDEEGKRIIITGETYDKDTLNRMRARVKHPSYQPSGPLEIPINFELSYGENPDIAEIVDLLTITESYM